MGRVEPSFKQFLYSTLNIQLMAPQIKVASGQHLRQVGGVTADEDLPLEGNDQ